MKKDFIVIINPARTEPVRSGGRSMGKQTSNPSRKATAGKAGSGVRQK